MNELKAIKIIKYESNEDDKLMWRSTENGKRKHITTELIYYLRDKGYIEVNGKDNERPWAIRLTEKGWDASQWPKRNELIFYTRKRNRKYSRKSNYDYQMQNVQLINVVGLLSLVIASTIIFPKEDIGNKSE